MERMNAQRCGHRDLAATRAFPVLNCLLAFFATGCLHPTIGPRSLPRDRASYSVSLADSWKQKTLLNIVKIRYVDPPSLWTSATLWPAIAQQIQLFTMADTGAKEESLPVVTIPAR
jgi:hypothetical protein